MRRASRVAPSGDGVQVGDDGTLIVTSAARSRSAVLPLAVAAQDEREAVAERYSFK